MIGKLHEQSREPCILPLQLDKIKFTKHHRVFISNTLNFPEYSSLLIDRIDKIPMHSLFSRNNLMLSVLPSAYG